MNGPETERDSDASTFLTSHYDAPREPHTPLAGTLLFLSMVPQS